MKQEFVFKYLDFEFIWKKTFDIFGFLLTFSIDDVNDWIEQAWHFGGHFLFALVDWEWSLVSALSFEFHDGTQGHIEDWKEGFNLFPDFVFRLSGVVAGFFIKHYLFR